VCRRRQLPAGVSQLPDLHLQVPVLTLHSGYSDLRLWHRVRGKGRIEVEVEVEVGGKGRNVIWHRGGGCGKGGKEALERMRWR
jgi:hypothetical protein